MKQKLYIIVLNWNRCNDTIECINSLKDANYNGIESHILVVDNGSTDNSLKELSIIKDIIFIETGQNLGFTGGNNQGIQHALNEAADYILILNNDTIVHKDFALELINEAKKNKDAGMLCSKMFFFDDPNKIWYAGAWFNTCIGYGRHIGYGQNDSSIYDKLMEINRPCGCSMLLTRKLCEEVGLLDDKYFCYAEELDWYLRAKKKGFKCLFVPKSKIWHKISSSTGGASSPVYLYYVTRNLLYCLNTNAPYRFKLLNVIRGMLVVLSNIASLFTLRLPKKAGLKLIFKGLADLKANKFGKLS